MTCKHNATRNYYTYPNLRLVSIYIYIYCIYICMYVYICNIHTYIYVCIYIYIYGNAYQPLVVQLLIAADEGCPR